MEIYPTEAEEYYWGQKLKDRNVVKGPDETRSNKEIAAFLGMLADEGIEDL